MAQGPALVAARAEQARGQARRSSLGVGLSRPADGEAAARASGSCPPATRPHRALAAACSHAPKAFRNCALAVDAWPSATFPGLRACADRLQDCLARVWPKTERGSGHWCCWAFGVRLRCCVVFFAPARTCLSAALCPQAADICASSSRPWLHCFALVRLPLASGALRERVSQLAALRCLMRRLPVVPSSTRLAQIRPRLLLGAGSLFACVPCCRGGGPSKGAPGERGAESGPVSRASEHRSRSTRGVCACCGPARRRHRAGLPVRLRLAFWPACSLGHRWAQSAGARWHALECGGMPLRCSFPLGVRHGPSQRRPCWPWVARRQRGRLASKP